MLQLYIVYCTTWALYCIVPSGVTDRSRAGGSSEAPALPSQLLIVMRGMIQNTKIKHKNVYFEITHRGKTHICIEFSIGWKD